MVPQGMNPFLKDMIEVASWVAAIAGGLTAAVVGRRQLESNLEQRKVEFRWKQANAAREIISDIHGNEWARNAVTMLDWSEGKRIFKFQDEDGVELSYERDVLPALQKSQKDVSGVEQDIVYCFDWFFYYINRIEHYINTNLIEFTDVEDVVMLYSKKIKDHESIFNAFMTSHSYQLATAFWKRRSAPV